MNSVRFPFGAKCHKDVECGPSHSIFSVDGAMAVVAGTLKRTRTLHHYEVSKQPTGEQTAQQKLGFVEFSICFIRITANGTNCLSVFAITSRVVQLIDNHIRVTCSKW